MTTSDLPDDALPEGFSVPDDLSSLSDLSSPAEPAAIPTAAGPVAADPAAAAAVAADPATAPDAAAAAPEAPAHKIAIILTQVATAEALAAACAVNKIVVDAVTSPVGAYAICRDLSEGAPAELARAVSTLVKTVPLILFEAAGGQVKASQWQGGKRLGDMPAALVLDGAPHEFEDLLFGTTTVHDLPGVVSSAGMSRWKAMRNLSGKARKQRGGE
ncbi:hypothetical protein SAMN05216410_2279 [Sanguibacter gelidistatuariae]|uniref:Uncharacterized protein n=1 Tax=Sanguibacter gelidistatuariae TaxID=1814289 RepID=A0A1G6P215_9MICO|nr:hypothetical protein [Sanguibacter gelidistatuariae]SDC73465.1 hypothetical protein SAMN05216410_2279 [Sanguibacter gelidistatuariae]